VAWPFDALINLGSGIDEPAQRARDDGRRRLVVLQHGLWRTSASLARLERTLRAHGYDVLNPGYPSTRGYIEEFAASLHVAIERHCRERPADEIAFVGHSMGGLVIQEYLRRPDARRPWACVYLATPHRGAVLADLRRHWFLFRLAMGDRAAQQLSPGHSFHLRPIPAGEVSGTLVGDRGACNPSIRGNDDGTVAVGEATFAGAKASLRLPVGHTAITTAPAVHRQVLRFLREGTFAPVGPER
jgi:pimeloyl-ACP methyl ester carboxylesterase